jgi:hypothetical protein
VVKDLRACCIPLPIVGFDAFLLPGPVEPAPKRIIADSSLLDTRTATPRIEVRTPRRIPPICSRGASPRSLPPRTFRTPSIRDPPADSVSSLVILVVSMGRRPSRLCSADGSVPSHTVFGRTLAYPPWALFPFEVAFMSVLAFRPSFDDALHHRRSAPAYRCSRVRPSHCCSTISRGSVRRAPCRVRVLRTRDPSCLGNPTYSSSGCIIQRMTLHRSAAATSHPPKRTL